MLNKGNMLDNIDVSIIVPVYNMENYLDRCLKSLVNQTLKKIEIICINDCSTDNSLEILKEYKKKYKNKIKIIDSKVNLKQGGARNLGIRESVGKYIGFVDSDDWVELDMFEKLISKAKTNESTIVYCDYYETLSEKGPCYKMNRLKHIKGIKNIQDIKKKLLASPCSIWSGIYSRDLFVNNDLYFPEKIFYEDNYLVPLLVIHSKYIYKVDEPLLFYFKGNISTTRGFNSEKFLDRIKISELLLEKLKKEKLLKEYEKELEFYLTEIYLINTSIGFLRNFYPIKLREIYYLKEKIKEVFPDYKKNKYYKEKCKQNFLYSYYNKFLNFPKILYCLYFTKSYFKYRKVMRETMKSENK